MFFPSSRPGRCRAPVRRRSRTAKDDGIRTWSAGCRPVPLGGRSSAAGAGWGGAPRWRDRRGQHDGDLGAGTPFGDRPQAGPGRHPPTDPGSIRHRVPHPVRSRRARRSHPGCAGHDRVCRPPGLAVGPATLGGLVRRGTHGAHRSDRRPQPGVPGKSNVADGSTQRLLMTQGRERSADDLAPPASGTPTSSRPCAARSTRRVIATYEVGDVRRGQRRMKAPMKSPLVLSQQQQGRLHARLHGSRGRRRVSWLNRAGGRRNRPHGRGRSRSG